MNRVEVATLIVVLGTILIASCSTSDSYKLILTVRDHETKAAIDSVLISYGWEMEDTVSYDGCCYTNPKGRAVIDGGFADPTDLVFRFDKDGYRTREIPGRKVVHEDDSLYRLDVALTPVSKIR